jgi:hypothetical protein
MFTPRRHGDRSLILHALGPFFTGAFTSEKQGPKNCSCRKTRACFSFTRNRNEHRKKTVFVDRAGFSLAREKPGRKKNRHGVFKDALFAKIFICCTTTRKTYTHQNS